MTKLEKKEVCDKCDISYVCDHKSMPDCDDIKEKEIEEMINDFRKIIQENYADDTDLIPIIKDAYHMGYGKVEDYKKEIERLKNIIATSKQYSGIDLAFEDEYGCLDTKQEKQQAIKEFAEKLRDRLTVEFVACDRLFIRKQIDKLLKEYGVEL